MRLITLALAAATAGNLLLASAAQADNKAIATDEMEAYLEFVDYGGGVIVAEQIPKDEWPKMVVIDARDPAQVGRAKRFLDERGGRLKVILTGGSYLDLMRRWKQPVFFDQQGSLAEKLGIRHVPALVSQEDRRLRIDELL